MIYVTFVLHPLNSIPHRISYRTTGLRKALLNKLCFIEHAFNSCTSRLHLGQIFVTPSMASLNSHSAADSPLPAHRARRIPDQEWDVWRDKLVKLYIEDGMTLKDIIDTMENEHSFPIT